MRGENKRLTIDITRSKESTYDLYLASRMGGGKRGSGPPFLHNDRGGAVSFSKDMQSSTSGSTVVCNYTT